MPIVNLSDMIGFVAVAREESFTKAPNKLAPVPVHSFETPIWAYAAMGIGPS